MKRTGNTIYIILCLLLCLLPFIGMTFAATNTTTENRAMAELPKLIENDKWNQKYLQELGVYFEDHFAFRPVLVTADSIIQSRVFQVSNMDTVIVGSKGWLYYTSTLKDYLGEQTLSEKGIWNAAHNLSLMQQSVEARGADFLLTVAPNKNSLYGENMPYYDSKKISDANNMALLKTQLGKWSIPYADLFAAFEREKEVLYLKRDSHWNRKGAVLAYDTMLDYLKLEHETYETVNGIRTKEEYGDLDKMLYPLRLEPEWNYTYQKEYTYEYVTDTESVEDAWIQTENINGTGSLLMFRDSFGNTLLPLMADTFENAWFAKSVPYNLEEYLDTCHPEYVIIEKVERNVDDFALEPPIVTGPLITLDKEIEMTEADVTLALQESEYDTAYWEIRGTVPDTLPMETRIYIQITQNGQTAVYEAFTISDEVTDYGYLLYAAKDCLASGKVQIDVLTEADGILQCVKTCVFDISQLINTDAGMED